MLARCHVRKTGIELSLYFMYRYPSRIAISVFRIMYAFEAFRQLPRNYITGYRITH
jgi:hypothetical protein